MLLLLAAAAGCVDAVSYLALGEVFTSAMTGNTALLGIAVGHGDLLAALRSVVALGGFMAGAVTGAAIVERGLDEAPWPRAVTVALAVEALILIALTIGWHVAGDGLGHAAINLLVAVTGLAMGMQSVAVNRLGVAGVSTTYVTGTLSHLGVRFVRWLRPAGAARGERPLAGDPWFLAGVWLAYGGGAILAGGLKLLWPETAAPILAGAPLAWHTVAMTLAALMVVLVVAAATGSSARSRG